MNESDWAKVENALQNLYDPVQLTCDGYRLTLCLSRVGTYRNAISVFVDGRFKMSWLFADCEQRRRFFCPVTQRLYSRRMFKGISKRALKHINVDPDRTMTYYRSHWTSFKRLHNHLIRNNQQISLIKKIETEAA